MVKRDVFRWVLASVMAAVMIAGAALGTAAASVNLPGDGALSVKRVVERAELATASTVQVRARLGQQFALRGAMAEIGFDSPLPTPEPSMTPEVEHGTPEVEHETPEVEHGTPEPSHTPEVHTPESDHDPEMSTPEPEHAPEVGGNSNGNGGHDRHDDSGGGDGSHGSGGGKDD